MSGGGTPEMTPGSSPRVPLHVNLEGGSVSRGPLGLMDFFFLMARWGFVLMVMCFLWLLGSGVIRKLNVQSIPANGLPSTSRDKSPSVAPKQFIREELPEKSIKTFDDVKVICGKDA